MALKEEAVAYGARPNMLQSSLLFLAPYQLVIRFGHSLQLLILANFNVSTNFNTPILRYDGASFEQLACKDSSQS